MLSTHMLNLKLQYPFVKFIRYLRETKGSICLEIELWCFYGHLLATILYIK